MPAACRCLPAWRTAATCAGWLLPPGTSGTIATLIGRAGDGPRIGTSFQELRLLQGDDGKATLRHGLQVAPAGDAGLVGAYILDLDYYDDRVLPFDRDQHVEQFGSSRPA